MTGAGSDSSDGSRPAGNGWAGLPVENGRVQVQLRIAPRTVVMIAAIVLLFWGAVQVAYALDTLIFWVLTAVFLAMASDPAVQAFQRWGMRRGHALLTFFAALVVVLTIIGSVFVPLVVEQSEELIRAVPAYINELQSSDWFQRLDERFEVLEQAAGYLEALPAAVSSGVGTVVNGLINGVFGMVTILLLTIFLLIDGERLFKNAMLVAPQIGKRRWYELSRALYHNVGRYVSGRVMVSLAGSTLLLVVMTLIGMPSVLPLAMWMFLWGLIPMVGATIGSAPAILVSFFYSDPIFGNNLASGIFLVVFIIVYQQVENGYIEPRVVGKTVSLAPFVVFLSILIGGSLLGVIGALMAIPVAGVIQVALRDLVAAQVDGEYLAAAAPPTDDAGTDSPTAAGEGNEGPAA